jgi:hypothetical protein
MPEDIEHQITEMAKPYFPTAPSDRLRTLLRELPPTDSVFKQITQATDKAALEVAYESNRFLVDYTFQADEETVSVIKLDRVLGVFFTDAPAFSTLRISAGDQFFTYTASVTSYRQELERYGRRVRQLISTDA